MKLIALLMTLSSLTAQASNLYYDQIVEKFNGASAAIDPNAFPALANFDSSGVKCMSVEAADDALLLDVKVGLHSVNEPSPGPLFGNVKRTFLLSSTLISVINESVPGSGVDTFVGPQEVVTWGAYNITGRQSSGRITFRADESYVYFIETHKSVYYDDDGDYSSTSETSLAGYCWWQQ